MAHGSSRIRAFLRPTRRLRGRFTQRLLLVSAQVREGARVQQTRLLCAMPAPFSGLFITIGVPSGRSATAPGFTFSYAAPVVSAALAADGTKITNGGLLGVSTVGQTVSVVGSGFGSPAVGNITVVFSGTYTVGLPVVLAQADGQLQVRRRCYLHGPLTRGPHGPRCHHVLQVTLPRGVGVNISLQVRIGGQWSSAFLLGYAAPTVSAVAPQRGQTAGGSSLSVGGSNWGNDPSPVITVGGVACPLIPGSYVPNPGQSVAAQCVLPRGQGFALQTTVTVGGQASPPSAAGLYDYGRPTLASVAPTTGPTSGRQTPAMVIDPVSGAVSFVQGPQLVMTVRACGCRAYLALPCPLHR